ncbi:MAG: glycoside hydrolase family 13 protein [Ruminococcaceae bacterium]|nr:glycoside hydrolase family 13 protein [Oscillospiraceae bacterium]
MSGKVLYLHSGKELGTGAFELNKRAELRILLPRTLGVVSVFLKLYNESVSFFKKSECSHVSSDLENDVYRIRLEKLPVGLYFFSFDIECIAGSLFGMKGKGRELVLSENEYGNHFQFSVVNFEYPEPEKYYGGIIYHIFVDRFNKGGSVPVRDDAILMDEWEGAIPEYPPYPGAHLENNTFFGGTLYGIIEKLDYIKSLGTTLIYLSPIFEAYSNHKYDTGDYMKVDEMFGGEKALKKLISEAKKRDIGIILDGVFNHTGSDSVYFNREGRYKTLGAYQSKESPYYKWYDFQSFPDKYTSWWGIKILPRINPDIRECGEFIAGNGGVIEKYSRLGIAGFRLDVADELSDSFISKIKSKMLEATEPTLLYGEVWEDASNKIAYDKRKHYYLGSELDGVMNYPLRTGIISFLKEKDKTALEYEFLDVMFNAPIRVRNMQMNLLGTHDTERIITMLAGDSAKGKSNDELANMSLDKKQKTNGIALLKMAYVILATVPGLPTVFYGDEVGLEGYKDPFNRRPYPWKSGNGEIRDFYKKIGAIRRSREVYRDGEFSLVYMDNERLVFSRGKNGKSLFTVINNSEKEMKVTFSSVSESLIKSEKTKQFVISPASSEIIETKTKTIIEID